MPGVDKVNAGVATKPPSLPLFARMHPPPALNHPALGTDRLVDYAAHMDVPGTVYTSCKLDVL